MKTQGAQGAHYTPLRDKRSILTQCASGPRSGDVFGELCLFDNEPRSTTVEGLNQGQLIKIDVNRLNKWLESHPAVGLKTSREYCGALISRLRKANQRVESLLVWGLRAHGIEQAYLSPVVENWRGSPLVRNRNYRKEQCQKRLSGMGGALTAASCSRTRPRLTSPFWTSSQPEVSVTSGRSGASSGARSAYFTASGWPTSCRNEKLKILHYAPLFSRSICAISDTPTASRPSETG